MVTDMQRLHGHAGAVRAVQNYIREHLDEPLDRARLAEVAGFSVPHLHRLFVGEAGESVASYVRRVRLERAGRKLRMGAVDIGEVALAAGYESHAAFSKVFRQYFGVSPSAFRQLDCPTATSLLRKG